MKNFSEYYPRFFHCTSEGGLGNHHFIENVKISNLFFCFEGMKMSLFIIFASHSKSDKTLFCLEHIHLGFEMVLFCYIDT